MNTRADRQAERAKKRRAARDTIAASLVKFRSSRAAPPPGYTRETWIATLEAHIEKHDREIQPTIGRW